MKNILKFVAGNPISFAVYHEEDGKQYTLSEGERYRLKIKRRLNDDSLLQFDSADHQFDVPSDGLPSGEYYFEISLVSSAGTETVISAATDRYGIRNNTLIITERL